MIDCRTRIHLKQHHFNTYFLAVEPIVKYARSEENVAQLTAKILIKFLQVSFELAKVRIVLSIQSTSSNGWREEEFVT